MKFKTLLLGFMLAVSFTASAQEFTPYKSMPAGVYKADPTHTSLTWKVSHAGLSNYTARFKTVDASLTFNPADAAKSSVAASIDTASLETDFVPTTERDFNKELTTDAKWFNGAQFPKITFQSTKVELTGNTKAKITGNLTMLGVTKPVVLDATLNGAFAEQPFSKKPTFGFSATTKIKRSDWGLTTYVPMIGDNVDIIIETEFAKAD